VQSFIKVSVPSKVGRNAPNIFLVSRNALNTLSRRQIPSVLLCLSLDSTLEIMALSLQEKEKEKEKAQNIPANHVMGTSWDDWVPQDRVRKFTDENKELAAQLHNQMKLLQQKAPKSVGKGQGKRGANGSDFSSARGSEERTGSVAAAPGRGGPRRNRDYDLEHVSKFLLLYFFFPFESICCQKKT
jgi:hypothetical protein